MKITSMKTTFAPRMALVVAAAVTFLHQNAPAPSITTIDLGTASSFAILAGTPVISDAGGTSKIVTGDVGLYPGPGTIGLTALQVPGGTIYSRPGDDIKLLGAQSDLTTAYDIARLATTTGTISANQLGGKTLGPGVYNFAIPTDPANLTGILTLSGSGLFVFQVGADLQTAIASSVQFENGADACDVFWQVTSSANLLGSDFAGTIMALTSITVGNGVTVDGRLLARNGDVTLINDTITRSDCSANGGGVPDTGSTLLLLSSGLGTLLAFRRRFFSPA